LAGGTATYTATGDVVYGTVGPIPNTASVSSTAYEPYTSNNTAVVSTIVDTDRIFEDGFESGAFAR
jgi:hypothetical protein